MRAPSLAQTILHTALQRVLWDQRVVGQKAIRLLVPPSKVAARIAMLPVHCKRSVNHRLLPAGGSPLMPGACWPWQCVPLGQLLPATHLSGQWYRPDALRLVPLSLPSASSQLVQAVSLWMAVSL